jgi:hypothetical protein
MTDKQEEFREDRFTSKEGEIVITKPGKEKDGKDDSEKK